MPTTPEQIRELGKGLLASAGIDLSSPEFLQALLPRPREKIVTGGWRSGKSTEAAAEILLDIWKHIILGDRDTLLYWVVGPQYGQTHAEFGYLKAWLTKLGGQGEEFVLERVSEPQDGPRRLSFKVPKDAASWLSVTVETKSAEHEERLGSVAPDAILVVEAGQCPEGLMTMMQGRSLEKRCDITYTGTLEDDENRPRWAWYSDTAEAWQESDDPRVGAYSLPTWANRAVFPLGEEDPEIVYRKENWDEYTFGRRIAGRPMGLQFQVYPQLDFKESDLLVPMPPGLQWTRSAGGIDYGTVHPSVLVVMSVTPFQGPEERRAPQGVAWVRECRVNDGPDSGNVFWLNRNKDELSKKYGCYNWWVDPNERFLAKNDAWSVNVSGSSGAREYRMGLTGTRLDYDRLKFDKNGFGVPHLFEKMRRVHRYKTRQGELKFRRIDDDPPAALENAIEGTDGKVKRPLPRPAAIKYRKQSRKPEMVSI